MVGDAKRSLRRNANKASIACICIRPPEWAGLGGRPAVEQRDRWHSIESLLAQRAKEDAQRTRLRASRLLWRQLEDVRHPAELWKGTRIHLSHQVGAMHRHRGFSDAIHECNKEASHAWIEGDCRECVNDRRRIHRCAGRGTDRTLQTSHASASVARVRINKAGSSSTCGGSICILASIAIEILWCAFARVS